MNMTKPRLTVVALLAAFTVGLLFHESFRAAAAGDPARENKASPSDLAMKLIGTWKLEAASNPGSPSGIGTRLKLFTGTYWCVVQPDPKTGIILFEHGGRYELEGNTMRVTTDFAGRLTKSLIGKSTTFTIQCDGDTYKQGDPKGIFDETWKRVK
jgi:hypothetical protein